MLRRLLLFCLVIAVCFLVPRVPWLVAWDRWAVEALAASRDAGLNRFFRFFSAIGGTGGFLVLFFLPVGYFLARRRIATAAWYFFGVGILKLSVSLLKILVARPRPPDGMEVLTTLSMPSGHAANAVFMFGVLGVFFCRMISARVLRVFSVALCLLAIFCIDLSRVYLGVHYPSDVVLGSLYAAAGLWVLQGLRRDLFDFA
ncbi:MAG: phosphatase PAP2 family protein [bacterium]